jgi:hypothetical protein
MTMEDSSLLGGWLLPLFVLEVIILTALFGVLANLKIPGISFLQTFMDAMWSLMAAHLLILKGDSLHIWEQPERG